MDIRKSQRLSQYLGLVSDQVEYVEINKFMLESGVLSAKEDYQLLIRLRAEGNASAMNELLTIVNLRRGGFDTLISALRKSEYIWLAGQLDPDKSLTCPENASTNGQRDSKGVLANVYKRISKKSEPDLVQCGRDDANIMSFMSYRDDFPMNFMINPNPGCRVSGGDYRYRNSSISYSDGLSEASDTRPKSQDSLAEMMECSTFTISDNQDVQNDLVVVHNVTSEHIEDSGNGDHNFEETKKYFTALAKRANVPLPAINGLKVLKKKGISKIVSNRKQSKVKLKFGTEAARNLFVINLRQYIDNVKPTDALYKSVHPLKVSIPTKEKEKGKSSKYTNDKKGYHDPPKNSSTNKHWYQKPFKFKSWKL